MSYLEKVSLNYSSFDTIHRQAYVQAEFCATMSCGGG